MWEQGLCFVCKQSQITDWLHLSRHLRSRQTLLSSFICTSSDHGERCSTYHFGKYMVYTEPVCMSIAFDILKLKNRPLIICDLLFSIKKKSTWDNMILYLCMYKTRVYTCFKSLGFKRCRVYIYHDYLSVSWFSLQCSCQGATRKYSNTPGILQFSNYRGSPFFHSVSSVPQLCPTLCDPMDCSTRGLPLHHQLLELAQTHVHWVGDAIQPSHPLSSPSPPALNFCQHQGL